MNAGTGAPHPAAVAPEPVCFRVLGPVESVCAGQLVEIGSAKTRALLAALLLQANRSVSVSALTEVLWGERPPPTYRSTLHSHIMRLRHLLRRHSRADIVRTEPGGYLIEANAATLDLLAFKQLLATAEQAVRVGDRAGELAALTEAAGLWRGPLLSNVESDVLHREEVPRLTERLLETVERRIDVSLAFGRHAELIGDLRELTARYPRHERFWGQLMEALSRTGRRSEALAAYGALRRILAEELGIDPGPELRDLQLRILRGDPLATAAPLPPRRALPVPSAPSTPVAPMCQLPLDVPRLVGRTAVLAELAGLVTAGPATARSRIVVLHGAPAVGKTAVAVSLAHQVRPQFPDGQWFVPLGGSTTAVRRCGEVLADLLHCAGLRPGQIPAGDHARAALLRAVLADRAVLLVLDDAAHLSQVEPLLPGAGPSTALVTSRRGLRGLAVLYGATLRRLDPLTPQDSLRLLRDLAGDQAADTPAALRLARLCGHLPLALRIAAANLLAEPELPLADYVARLDRPDRLDRLCVPGDERLSMRAIIAGSWASLDPPAYRALAVLARHPAGPVSAPEAAALLGMPLEQARALLVGLVETGMVEERGHDFSMPDLVRLYAAAAPLDPAPGAAM